MTRIQSARFLRLFEPNHPVSELVNEVIRERLVEGAEDLYAVRERADVQVIRYEGVLKKLQTDGKLMDRS